MSKQIQAMFDKHPERFESWHNEDHNMRGLDYWVYCKAPYYSPENECQTIHTDTVADALAYMRDVAKGEFDGYGWGPAL